MSFNDTREDGTVFRFLSSDRGMALPMVLVVIVIFVMFSAAILAMGLVDTEWSVLDSNKAQAYYYAHSGAEAVGSYIVENPDNLSSAELKKLVDKLVEKGESMPFKLSSSDEGTIRVNVTRSGKIISIISSSTYKGSSGSVTLNIEEKTAAGEPFDKTVYSESKLTIDEGGRIEGDIACLGKIYFNNGSVTGKVFISPNADSSAVEHPDWIRPVVDRLDEIYEYDVFPFPDYPAYPVGLPADSRTLSAGWNQTVEINNDVYYTNGIDVSNGTLKIIRNNTGRVIRTKYLHVSGTGQVVDVHSGGGNLELFIDDDLELSNDTNMIFNLGDGDIIIRARKLLLRQGHIIVNHKGNGRMYIYVDDIMSLGGSSSINYTYNADEEELMKRSRKVFLYYSGTEDENGNDTVSTDNNNWQSFPQAIRIAATIHVKEAKVHIANGTGIVGNLISGGRAVKFDGGTNTVAKVVYAPEADVYVSGGARITGVIICNSFDIKGGANVVYDEVGPEDMDFFKDVAGKITYAYGNWQ